MSTTAKTDIAVAKAHIEELRMRGGEFTADSLERLVDAYCDLCEEARKPKPTDKPPTVEPPLITEPSNGDGR